MDTAYSSLSDCLQRLQIAADIHDISELQRTFRYLKALSPFSWSELRQLIVFVVKRNLHPQEYLWLQRLVNTIRFLTLDFHAYLSRRYDAHIANALITRLTQFIECLLSNKRWMETINTLDSPPSSLIYELMLLRSDLVDYKNTTSNLFSFNPIHHVYQLCYTLIYRPHFDILMQLLYQLDQLRQRQPLTLQDPFGIYVAIDILAITMKKVIKADLQQTLWNGCENYPPCSPQERLPGFRHYFQFALQLNQHGTKVTTPLYKWFEEAILLSLSNYLSKDITSALISQIQQNSRLVSDRKCIQHLTQSIQLFSTQTVHLKIISLPHYYLDNICIRPSYMDRIDRILLKKHQICNITSVPESQRDEFKDRQTNHNEDHQGNQKSIANGKLQSNGINVNQSYDMVRAHRELWNANGNGSKDRLLGQEEQLETTIVQKFDNWLKPNGNYGQSVKLDLLTDCSDEYNTNQNESKDSDNSYLDSLTSKDSQLIGTDSIRYNNEILKAEHELVGQFSIGWSPKYKTNHSREHRSKSQEVLENGSRQCIIKDGNDGISETNKYFEGYMLDECWLLKYQDISDTYQSKENLSEQLLDSELLKNCKADFCQGQKIENLYRLHHNQFKTSCGTGKTSLAIHYAILHQSEFDVIYYLKADSILSLQQDFVQLGAMLIDKYRHRKNEQICKLSKIFSTYYKDLTVKAKQRQNLLQISHCNSDTNELIEAILKLLLDPITGKLLLIYDNAEDNEWIHRYFPKRYHCYIIVISAAPFTRFVTLKVDIFDRQLSIYYLCKCLNQDDRESANNIASKMKDLPLALFLAKTFIYQQDISLASYVYKYRQVEREIKPLINAMYSLPSMVVTNLNQALDINLILPWYINVQLASENNPTAETVISILAYLDPNKIEIRFLYGIIERISSKKSQLLSILRRFHIYGLINCIDEHNYSISRCLQTVIRCMATIKGEEVNLLSFIITYFIDQLRLDYCDKINWEISQLAIRHLQVAFEHAKIHPILRPLMIQAAAWLSYSFCIHNSYHQAKIYADQWLVAFEAVESEKQTWKGSREIFISIPENQLIYRGFHNLCLYNGITAKAMYALLGKIYCQIGKNNQSLEYLQKSLAIRLQKMGPEHLSVASTYEIIGRVLCYLGQPTNALRYLQKSLTIKISYLGNGHVNVAATHHIIGLANYISIEQSDKAIQHLNKSLNVKIQHFNEHSLDLANSYLALAKLHFYRNRFQSAITEYLNAFDIEIHKLGRNHIRVGQTSFYLGETYHMMKDFNLAKQYYQYALQIFKIHFGYQHAKTANIYYCLGQVSYAEGQFITALDYFKQSIGIELDKYGSSHFKIAKTSYYMAELLYHLGDHNEAQKFYNVALTWNDPEIATLN
ncbi:Nephrocystin-3 [Trichoplax sp. H2]|nr:Nephrocystin-3 [Trichoplax sp. H2]|eukprot:RDD41758.1 Nephrocystin-3 [Trichoplax sp. H2]